MWSIWHPSTPCTYFAALSQITSYPQIFSKKLPPKLLIETKTTVYVFIFLWFSMENDKNINHYFHMNITSETNEQENTIRKLSKNLKLGIEEVQEISWFQKHDVFAICLARGGGENSSDNVCAFWLRLKSNYLSTEIYLLKTFFLLLLPPALLVWRSKSLKYIFVWYWHIVKVKRIACMCLQCIIHIHSACQSYKTHHKSSKSLYYERNFITLPF